jgi:BirA family transcriptional regulator, biotin operon repressor / biotin---[acetyl-CoA-carboxylase] ligase
MSISIIEFDEITSTSDYLKTNHQSLNHLTFVKTNYQTQGRGQFERTWESEKGLNLLFSVLFKPEKETDIQDIKNIILHAIINVLDTYGVSARYKAPNDLYVGKEKICGILIETKMNGQVPLYVIAGVGLNVNQSRFDAPNATSMYRITSKAFDISYVFKQLVGHITSVL